MDISFNMTDAEFLFGIINNNRDCDIDLYNRVFFLVRIFIWECRYFKNKPNLNKFISFLKKEIKYECENLRYKCKDVDKLLESRWRDLHIVLSIL